MIELKEVSYYIHNKAILVDINLKIKNNEFVAIIGPNGAGKTTLLQIILNQLTGVTGEVYIDGVLNSLWLRQNIMGYLPQREVFDKNFPATVKDIVLMGIAGQKGVFRSFTGKDKELAVEMLGMVGARHLKDQLIGCLSGGELQRVFIARALLTKSDYLLLDEPEAGVDKDKIKDFYDLLRILNKKGKTIILVSHDVHTVTKNCTNIICLNKSLHCHSQAELVNADMIQETYGDVLQLVEKKGKRKNAQ